MSTEEVPSVQQFSEDLPAPNQPASPYESLKANAEVSSFYANRQASQPTTELPAPEVESVEPNLPFSEEAKESVVVISQPSPPQEEEENLDLKTMKPGARLRHAREQRNLSRQHVADRLYLDVNVIQALENDDYDNLPSTIFVRGYLRNYARLLELPPDSILESYDLSGQPGSLPPLNSQIAATPKVHQVNSNNHWVSTMTVVIILAVLGFVALKQALQHFYSDSSLPIQGLADNPSQPSASSAASESAAKEAKVTEPARPSQEPESSSGNNKEIKIEPNPSITPSTPTNPPNSSTPGVLMPPIPTTSPPASGVITAEGIGSTVTVEKPPEKNPNALKIFLAKETWLRVVDKDGKKLFDGIGRKEVSVTGTPPFVVKLGHSEGVTMEYQGEKSVLKDHSSFNAKKKQVTVGGSSSGE